MTIYEPDDFGRQFDPEWMKFDRKVDNLKRIRLQIASEQKKKIEEGIPTSYDLACWFKK